LAFGMYILKLLAQRKFILAECQILCLLYR